MTVMHALIRSPAVSARGDGRGELAATPRHISLSLTGLS